MNESCSIQPLHCMCRAQYNNSTVRVNQHVNNMDLVLILTITVSIMIILIITILLLDMRISAQLICILLLVIWWRKRVMNELGYGAVCLLKGRPRLTVRCIKKIQAKDHVWGVQNKQFVAVSNSHNLDSKQVWCCSYSYNIRHKATPQYKSLQGHSALKVIQLPLWGI